MVENSLFLTQQLCPKYKDCSGASGALLPVQEVATPGPEGGCCMGRFKRYTKHWACDINTFYPSPPNNSPHSRDGSRWVCGIFGCWIRNLLGWVVFWMLLGGIFFY